MNFSTLPLVIPKSPETARSCFTEDFLVELRNVQEEGWS